jgi:hypothetical protein
MKTPKTKAPEVAQAVPVPQPDDPALIDVKRRTRTAAAGREGSRNSLLTPGGSRGVTGGSSGRKQLGYGAIASGM